MHIILDFDSLGSIRPKKLLVVSESNLLSGAP